MIELLLPDRLPAGGDAPARFTSAAVLAAFAARRTLPPPRLPRAPQPGPR